MTPGARLRPTTSTAQEHESDGELWIFAIAVDGSRGAPGEIVELVVDSGGAVTTCPPWFADALVIRGLSPRKLVEASGHALRYYGVRELDLSVAARQVRVKFVVTDVMHPVLSVAKLTERGVKVEFGQLACYMGTNKRDDGVTVEQRRRFGIYWTLMGQVCREVVNRGPCYTIGDESP